MSVYVDHEQNWGMFVVGCDTETEPTTDLCKVPRLVCGSFAARTPDSKHDDSIKTDIYHQSDPELRDQVAWVLEHGIWVGTNTPFDHGVYMRKWPELVTLVFDAYERDRVRDSIVTQKLIDIAHGELHRAPKPVGGTNYSLAAMAWRHLDRDLDKSFRDDYGRLLDVPLEQWEPPFVEYPQDDARAHLEVDEAQQLGWPDLLADQYRQTRHAFWLYLVGAEGIRTDPARVARFKERLLDERADHFRTLRAAGLIRPKRKRDPEGEQVLCEKLGRARMAEIFPRTSHPGRWTAPTQTYPQGQCSVDYQTCVDSGDDVMLAYGEYASVRKQLSADIPKLELGELHCRFDSLKETGRTGCSDPYNLQNPPREVGVRECFVPRPGCVFVDADYDGLESRAGAQACLEIVGQSSMADALNAGEDLHLHMAASLLGVDYATAVKRYKAHKLCKKTRGREGTNDPAIAAMRQFAKIANFGLSGGMGAEKFFAHVVKELKKAAASEADLADARFILDLVKTVVWEGKERIERLDGTHYERPRRCTVEDCIAEEGQTCVTRVREVWRERWPEWPLYFERNGQMVPRQDKDDEEQQWSGAVAEQLFCGRFRGGLGYTDLNNTYFQGLGADAAKAAGWRLARACYDPSVGSPLLGCAIVNFVHDQFLVEVPAERGPECAAEVGRVMIEEANKWFPDVPATTTPCLAMCWSKDAVAVLDERGILVPWSPSE